MPISISAMDFALQCLLENHKTLVEPDKKLDTQEDNREDFKQLVPDHLRFLVTNDMVNSTKLTKNKIIILAKQWRKWVNKMSLPFAVLKVLPKDVQKRIAYYVVQDDPAVRNIYNKVIKNSISQHLSFNLWQDSEESIRQKIKTLKNQSLEKTNSRTLSWLMNVYNKLINRKGLEQKVFVSSDKSVTSLDNNQIVEVVDKNFILITDLQKKQVRTFKASNASISCIFLTTDQRHIIAVSEDKTISAWDFNTLEKANAIKIGIKKVGRTNNNYFVSLTGNNRLFLLDPIKGKIIKSTKEITDPQHVNTPIDAVVFNKKNNVLIFAGKNSIGLWDLGNRDKKEQIFSFNRSDREIASISTYDDEVAILFYIRNFDKNLKIEIWDIALQNKLETIKRGKIPVHHYWPWLVDNYLVNDKSVYDFKKINNLSFTPFLSALVLQRIDRKKINRSIKNIAYQQYLKELEGYGNKETYTEFTHTLKHYFKLAPKPSDVVNKSADKRCDVSQQILIGIANVVLLAGLYCYLN